jgi:hypothetical protein
VSNLQIKDRVESMYARGIPGIIQDIQCGMAEVMWDEDRPTLWTLQLLDELVPHQLQ